MKHILLVDDDNELSELLTEYLQEHGFQVTAVENGEQALALLQEDNVDLMVLDIMMPIMDGLTVLKSLPHNHALPVIMLTAKGDDVDRIVGLELGADDYMTKPCNPRELLARINAVLKRAQSHGLPNGGSPDTASETESDTPPNILTNRGLVLDTAWRTCHINDTEVALTSTEFDLLKLLLIHKGEVISKEQLSRDILQRELQPFDRSIDVHISRLRKKLTVHQDDTIRSVRGKGYQLII